MAVFFNVALVNLSATELEASLEFKISMNTIDQVFSIDDIKVSGYGNFLLTIQSPRPGRNPKTGEEVTISERRVVTFKSGLKLKSKLEAYDGNK